MTQINRLIQTAKAGISFGWKIVKYSWFGKQYTSHYLTYPILSYSATKTFRMLFLSWWMKFSQKIRYQLRFNRPLNGTTLNSFSNFCRWKQPSLLMSRTRLGCSEKKHNKSCRFHHSHINLILCHDPLLFYRYIHRIFVRTVFFDSTLEESRKTYKKIHYVCFSSNKYALSSVQWCPEPLAKIFFGISTRKV